MEFYGLNNALLTTNKEHLSIDSPWKDAAFTLQADVHKTAGMTCTSCHTGNEMHGLGAPLNDDRYAVTNAAGWVAPTNQAGEGTANASLLIKAPFPFTILGSSQ